MKSQVRAIALDVDGVLTDGSVRIDDQGRESKELSFADVMGISLGQRAGLRFALVSGEGGPLLTAIASKLGIADVYPSCRDKAAAVRDFAERADTDLSEVCFIGDDINDVEAMKLCGYPAAPATAHPAALEAAVLITLHPGGTGAVREVIDRLVKT